MLSFNKYRIQNMIKLIFYGAILVMCNISGIAAQEITAIDFNGDLLGKVIPDGKVVSYDNELIGK